MPNKIEQEMIKNKKIAILALIIGGLSFVFNIILLFIIL